MITYTYAFFYNGMPRTWASAGLRYPASEMEKDVIIARAEHHRDLYIAKHPTLTKEDAAKFEGRWIQGGEDVITKS